MTAREAPERPPAVSQAFGADGPASGAGGRAAVARARWAVTALFLVNGMVLASYFVRIPALKRAHHLTDGQLGIVLTVAAVAALLSMQFAGSLAARFGSARIARLSAAALPVSLLGLGLADGPIQLMLALVAFGAVGGLLDVAMNAQAIAVEQALKRPIMNGCHAAWSIGAIIGSLLGGIAIKAGWSLTEHYLWLAPGVVVFAAVTGRWMLSVRADRSPSPAKDIRRARQWLAGWTPRVLLFGAMGAAVMLCEGTVATWSGVFMHDDRGAALATASLAYIGFTVCEASGRLIGDRLQKRYGASTLVRTSGVVAMAGLALGLTPWPPLEIVGFGILGAGLSVLLPVIFSAVGHSSGGDTGAAGVAAILSRFTTMAYSGILIGPLLIGWLADVIGLGWTLAGMQVLIIGVVLAAKRTAAADRQEKLPAS